MSGYAQIAGSQYQVAAPRQAFMIVNCRGPHEDGFGENFRVYTHDDTPASCPKCGNTQNTGKLRVMMYR